MDTKDGIKIILYYAKNHANAIFLSNITEKNIEIVFMMDHTDLGAAIINNTLQMDGCIAWKNATQILVSIMVFV